MTFAWHHYIEPYRCSHDRLFVIGHLSLTITNLFLYSTQLYLTLFR